MTPGGFFENDRTTQLDMESESADELRRIICKRSFNLPRWAGEEGPHGTVSVGVHSLLVSFLAGRLAMARDCSDEIIRLAKAIGAVHDGGERTGGIGDVISPIIRAYPGVKEANEDCQAAAFRLFDPWIGWSGLMSEDIGAQLIVKDADHLAAAIERRYLFDDDSGDQVCAYAKDLMAECGVVWVHMWDSFDGKGLEIATFTGPRHFLQTGPDELERAIKCEL